MRSVLALAVLAAGCTGLPENGPHHDSIYERLSDAPAWLFVRAETSSGSAIARRRDGDGWQSALAELAVERGYVRATIDDSGQLEITQLEIAFAPITLDAMFDAPAQLEDVHLRLAGPVRGEPAWRSEDDVSATLVAALDFGGAIAVGGDDAIPLVTAHLPPVTIDVALYGEGDRITASLAIAATGELWDWENAVELTELTLAVTAETVN